MGKIMPKGVREQIFRDTYALLDKHAYLMKDRVENGRFMDQLIEHERVGKRLAQYITKVGIRKYIKDSIINRYAKDRTRAPRDIGSHLTKLYGRMLGEIEYSKHEKVSLHKAEDQSFVVAARTTTLKWETGLRKAITYVANAPGLPQDRSKVHCVLLIAQTAGPMNSGDRDLVERALKFIAVDCAWI